MIIYPAIDLRGGKVVRLRKGDPNRQITFSDDPVEVAKQWIDQGAEWLHMVNLDGAFATRNENLRILEGVASLKVKIQYGGGLRSKEALSIAVNSGAARVVLGKLPAAHCECSHPFLQKLPSGHRSQRDRFGSNSLMYSPAEQF